MGPDHSHTIHTPAAYDANAAPRAYGDEAQAHERMLDAVHVAQGERVLDVGCGTGTLAIAAARRVGERGRVVGVDASAEMTDGFVVRSPADGGDCLDVAFTARKPGTYAVVVDLDHAGSWSLFVDVR